MRALMRPGMTNTAKPPKKRIRPSEIATGVINAISVGSVSACSSGHTS